MPDAKLPIVFSHANGFPAGTYRVLFDIWRAADAVHAIEKFGYDAAYPVTSNWPKLRDQLIHFTEREAKAPAVFVGHSLGGLLSLLAVCKRPDLAAGLVMIDSPVITGWRAHSLQVVKATGLVRRVSPGRISRTRRHECAQCDQLAATLKSVEIDIQLAIYRYHFYSESDAGKAGKQLYHALQLSQETKLDYWQAYCCCTWEHLTQY